MKKLIVNLQKSTLYCADESTDTDVTFYREYPKQQEVDR